MFLCCVVCERYLPNILSRNVYQQERQLMTIICFHPCNHKNRASFVAFWVHCVSIVWKCQQKFAIYRETNVAYFLKIAFCWLFKSWIHSPKLGLIHYKVNYYKQTCLLSWFLTYQLHSNWWIYIFQGDCINLSVRTDSPQTAGAGPEKLRSDESAQASGGSHHITAESLRQITSL